MSGTAYAALLNSARELLIDLERHDLDADLDDPELAALGGEAAPHSSPAASSSAAPRPAATSAEAQRASDHKELLLAQLDRLKQSLEVEQQSSRELRTENAKLSADMRTLAQQLKQERAASNAVLAVRVGSEPPAESKGEVAGEVGANGLTLASAASQILMLRREVKWLQKQWQSARRDQDGTANREQLEELQSQLDAARRKAAQAHEQAAAAAAQRRLLLRQLGSAKAQWEAQQARMRRRSAAQSEAAALRAQLQAAHEALLLEQQQRRQLQQNATRARGAGGDAAGAQAAGAEAALAAHLLRTELAALERGAEAQAASLAGLISAKSDIALRLAQADEDRAGLTIELSNLKERFAALAEQRDSMAASLAAPTPPPPAASAPPAAPPPPAADKPGIGRLMGGKLSGPKLELGGKLDFRLPGRSKQTAS